MSPSFTMCAELLRCRAWIPRAEFGTGLGRPLDDARRTGDLPAAPPGNQGALQTRC